MRYDHEALTVVEVDHHITNEEAQRIREAFEASVKDDRPMIVLGPGIKAFELEPYAVAYRRSTWALVIGIVSLIISITMMILVVWS